jgi:hypothetical protein
LSHHFTEIDQPIPHAPQGGVDAATREFSDLFKAHIGIMAKNDDFALIGRELIQHFPYAVVALVTNQALFRGFI